MEQALAQTTQSLPSVQTLLTRIEDGKIMKRNNYTCTAIDKGRSFLTDLESRSGY